MKIPALPIAFVLASVTLALPGRAAQRSAGPSSYLDPSFWSGVAADLEHEAVTVHLAAGHYHSGPLTLTALGNERNPLTIEGDGTGPIFDSDGDFLLYLKGCQNVRLHNLHFTGSAGKFGVTVIGLSEERRDAIIPVPAQTMHADMPANGPLATSTSTAAPGSTCRTCTTGRSACRFTPTMSPSATARSSGAGRSGTAT